MRASSTLGALCAAILAVACSTPQVALDHANNGVRLTQLMQAELTRYSQNSKLAADRRLATVQQQEASTLDTERVRALGDYLDAQSGRADDSVASARILRDASSKYTQLQDDEDKAQKDLADRLTAIVKDLPSPAEKLGAVQRALADLGTELSPAERFAIVSKFLEDSKAIVDKNAKAASDAASAPASAASSGT
jgi:hypothetical protein